MRTGCAGSPSAAVHGRGRTASRRYWRSPCCQLSNDVASAAAASSRTSRCTWSPVSMRVSRRGGIASFPRTIAITVASGGSGSSESGRPTTRSSGPTRYSASSAPSRPAVPVSRSARGNGGRVSVSFEPPREALERHALEDGREDDDEEGDVEDATAPGDSGDDGEGREHDRDAAAQSRPPEQHALAGAQPLERRHDPHCGGSRDEGQEEREHGGAAGHGHELRRHHQQPERQEERDLGDPGDALVKDRQRALRRQLARGGERDAGDVDREEARAVEHVRAAEGQPGDGERRNGIQAASGQAGDPQQADRADADSDAADEPQPELADEQHAMSGTP